MPHAYAEKKGDEEQDSRRGHDRRTRRRVPPERSVEAGGDGETPQRACGERHLLGRARDTARRGGRDNQQRRDQEHADDLETHRDDHREQYDVVTARAVGPLPVVLELAVPLARVGGLLLAIKGAAAIS